MGYEKEKDSFGNTVLLKNAPPGEIYLDFLPKQDMFHNTQVYLDIGKLSYQTPFPHIEVIPILVGYFTLLLEKHT